MPAALVNNMEDGWPEGRANLAQEGSAPFRDNGKRNSWPRFKGFRKCQTDEVRTR